MKDKFIATHIGGRSGSIGFPKDTAFNDSIEYIIFEADKNCIEQIKQKNPNAKVYPYFIGEKRGKVDFNINYSLFYSSVYDFNKKYKNYFRNKPGYDLVFENAYKVIKKINLEATSLDELLEKKVIPNIDFLSMNTEGSEYAILKGAKQSLKNIVAIETEINFIDRYKNSKLFSDIDQFLKDNGFIWAGVSAWGEYNTKRIQMEFRGRNMPLGCNALYLLDPNSIKSEESSVAKLEKLAFASIVFGYTGIAFDALEKVYNIKSSFNTSLSYQKFLKEFYFKIKNSKNPLPELWHNKFSFEDIEKQFLAENLNHDYYKLNIFQKSIYRIKKDPILFLKIALNFLYKKIFFKVLENFPITINFKKKYSKFGKFLKKYKLHLAAENFKY